MDKPEENKPPQGPLKPPVPPPLGKKPGPLPKGPVPPRAPVPPRPPVPAAKPAMPPLSGRPPLPPMPGAPAAARPPMPAMPGVPSLPPQVEKGMSDAEAAKNDLETKIADLEKKLLEEREKVLIANLRSKEEEAVSAKVETSIKEIQDKLRREKREAELDESKRKAEARLAEMERRIAEEREAWVATLKNQLGQRDQVTQEMESHFAARLKDLEYRWAQEKAALETALRDREAEATRIRQEAALKTEQEKGFWEDRIRQVAADRDKFEREIERIRDRVDQEKVQLVAERQMLRDQVLKLENAVKFAEDHARAEKLAVTREAETTVNLLRAQISSEKELLERQVAGLNVQLQAQARELSERATQFAAIEQQLAVQRAQVSQLESRLADRERQLDEARQSTANYKKFEELYRETAERVRSAETRAQGLESQIEDWRRRASEAEQESSVKRIQHEHQIEELRREIARAQSISQEEMGRQAGRIEAEFAEKRARYESELAALREQLDQARGANSEVASRIQARFEAEFTEKRKRYETEISSLNEQLARVKAAAQEEAARIQIRVESDFAERRRRMEEEIAAVRSEMSRDKASYDEAVVRERVSARNEVAKEREAAKEAIARIQQETEGRLRTLQARLEWYDTNATREYEAARAQAAQEIKTLEARAIAAERAMAEIKASEDHRKKILEDARESIDRANAQRAAVEEELSRVRTDLRKEQAARQELQSELRAKSQYVSENQKVVEVRDGQIEDLKARLVTLHEELSGERAKLKAAEAQLQDAATSLQAYGEGTVAALKAELHRKTVEIEALHAKTVEAEAAKADGESIKAMLAEKDAVIDDLKKRMADVLKHVEDGQTEMARLREELQVSQAASGASGSTVQAEMERISAEHRAEMDRLKAAHEQALEQARQEAAQTRTLGEGAAPDITSIENDVRARLENEFLDKLRDLETQTSEAKEAAQKDLEKFKWEADNAREELRRAREARSKIEREANDLLQQAEAHFRKELEKAKSEGSQPSAESAGGGIFTRIGRFLDSPVIEIGGKKKPAAEPEEPKE